MLDQLYETINWPSFERNLDTMRLLIDTKWFQTRVKKIRKIYDIPSTGHKRNFLSKGFKEEFRSNRPTCYVPLKERESWQYPNKRVTDMTGKQKETYEVIEEIYQITNLPLHFHKALLDYINYNKLSAPGTDFLIDINVRHSSHPAPIPQIRVLSRLDTNNAKLSSKMQNAILKKSDCYPSLQRERLDPKSSLERYIKELKIIKKIEKELSKKHGYVKDEDVASRWLDMQGFEDEESFGPENIRKTIKKIQNIRQYIALAYKERGIPQN